MKGRETGKQRTAHSAQKKRRETEGGRREKGGGKKRKSELLTGDSNVIIFVRTAC
jgi:hypothetical protein